MRHPLSDSLDVGRRIVAIGAHSDDVELGALGLLLTLAKAGAEIPICVLADGRRGGVASVRQRESASVAESLGAGLIWAGLPDTQVRLRPAIAVIERAVANVAPSLVLVHHPAARRSAKPCRRVSMPTPTLFARRLQEKSWPARQSPMLRRLCSYGPHGAVPMVCFWMLVSMSRRVSAASPHLSHEEVRLMRKATLQRLKSRLRTKNGQRSRCLTLESLERREVMSGLAEVAHAAAISTPVNVASTAGTAEAAYVGSQQIDGTAALKGAATKTAVNAGSSNGIALAAAAASAAQSNVQFTGLIHVQGRGDRPLRNDQWAGTKGQSLRLEGFQIDTNISVSGLSVEYMAHLEGSGDTKWVPAGTFVGTRGQSRRLEGFAIRLTGPAAAQYDIFYRAHLQGIGASAIAKNGVFCGTRGQSRRVEAMVVSIVPKGVVPNLDEPAVFPDATKDLRGKWGGPIQDLIRSVTPQKLLLHNRDSVTCQRFEYDPVTDRVQFSVTVTWRIKMFGREISKITMTAEGNVPLSNPSAGDFRVGWINDSDSTWATSDVRPALVNWFTSNRAAIRNS